MSQIGLSTCTRKILFVQFYRNLIKNEKIVKCLNEQIESVKPIAQQDFLFFSIF